MEQLTLSQFAKRMDWKSKEYARQHCRGQYVKGRQLTLPDGWKAIKIGTQWFVQQVNDTKSPTQLPQEESTSDALIKQLAKTLSDSGMMPHDEQQRVLTEVREDLMDNLDLDLLYRTARMKFISYLLLHHSEQPDDIKQMSDEQRYKHAFKIDKAISKLTRDSEICYEIAKQWNGYPQSSVDDLKDRIEAIASGSEIGGSLFSAPLKRPDKLFKKLQKAYKLAALGQQPSSITIEFQPDGTWTANKVATNDLAFIDEWFENHRTDSLGYPWGNTLDTLFNWVWVFQIEECRKNGGLNQNSLVPLYESEVVQSHPFFSEFRKRCLHCTAVIENRLSNKRFCSDVHRTAYNKWVHKCAMLAESEMHMKLRQRWIDTQHSRS
jgi:hypothetical protein